MTGNIAYFQNPYFLLSVAMETGFTKNAQGYQGGIYRILIQHTSKV